MSRFGIIVNVDKCVGCHACAIACKEENQVAPGIFYERVERFENIADNIGFLLFNHGLTVADGVAKR